MSLTSRYLRSTETSSIAYSRLPSHAFNVQELLQNRPCWETFAGHKTLRKKILVVDHAEIQRLSKMQRLVAAERFFELEQEGFQIHTWQNPYPVDPEISNHPEVPEKALLSYATEQLKLSHDDVFVLNRRELGDLMEGDDSDWSRLSDFANVDLSRSNISIASLKRLLQQKGHLITSLNLEGCINLYGADLSDLPPLPLLKELIIAVNDRASKRQNTLGSQSIINLVSSAPNLATLCIARVKGTSGIPFEKLPLLERFDGSESDLNEQSLKKILSDKKKFRSLNIQYCNELASAWIKRLPVPVDGLEEFATTYIKLEDVSFIGAAKHLNRFSHGLVHVDQLEKIAGMAPGIEALRIGPVTKFSYDSLSHHPFFESLKKLDLSVSSNFDTKALDRVKKFLNTMTSLEKLTLRGHIDPIADELSSSFLKNLKEFEIPYDSSSVVYVTSFLKLLLKTKQLQKLTLGACYFEGGEKSYVSLPFASLTEIHLGDACISSNLLGQFLTSAKNLKKLDLSSCTIYEGDFPDRLSLEHLEELYWHDAESNPDILKKIRAAAPKSLKVIGFCRAEKISKTLTPVIDNGNGTHAILHLPAPTTKRSETLDADTKYDPHKTFHIDQVFYAPHPKPDPKVNLYRESLYHHIRIEPQICNIQHAFRLDNVPEHPELAAVSLRPSSEKLYTTLDADKNQYMGVKTFLLDGQWQPLPSLSPMEKLISWHVPQHSPVTLAWSQRDNQYYIKGYGSVDMEWVVEIPKPDIKSLPQTIQEKIRDIWEFNNKALVMKQEKPTGQDYFNALLTQKTGACRHRALVFKEWMDRIHPEYQARIVMNTCHAFVEICHEGQWLSCDLGGYEANLVLKEPHRPSEKKPSPQAFLLNPRVTVPSDGSFSLPKTDDQWVLLPETTLSSKQWFGDSFPLSSEEPKELLPWLQYLLSGMDYKKDSKKLLEFQDSGNSARFRHHLQSWCKKTQRPCFYVSGPEDLLCSAPYMQIDEGNRGILNVGPGGPLHEFLTQKHAEPPVLIINYDAFTAQDLVRFNALLDDKREADGTPLPEKLHIIGLRNPTRPNAYHGADFISRFDQVRTCPFDSEALPVPEIFASEQKTDHRIECYAARNWKERLLGSWVMHGKALFFEEGALLKAFKQGNKAIELRNAPWDDPDFVRFWQEAMLYGTFQVQGKTFVLPENFSLTHSEGLSFIHTDILTQQDKPSPDAIVLNPGLVSRLLGRYVCDGINKTISRQKGLIEERQNHTLPLYLTAPLSSSVWAEILDNCRHYGVTLALCLAPGILLPPEMNLETKTGITPKMRAFQKIEKLPHTLCLESNDVDVTLHQLADSNTLVLDVSEVSSPDLLKKLDARFDEKTLSFEFSETQGALLRALQENKKIILKGHFSAELQQALHELLFARSHDTQPRGQLILLSDAKAFFPDAPGFVHDVTLEEKEKALRKHQLPIELVKKEPLCRLRAIQNHRMRNPESRHHQDAWSGLETAPPMPKTPCLSLQNSEVEAKSFHERRLSKVSSVLKNSPFVCLTGLTGVGKTTFVHTLWKQKHPNLWVGETNVCNWATDTRPGLKTLFIDEANIGQQDWSLLEGLFQDPPGILIGNQWYPLSKEHKIQLALNPGTYGGERKTPSFVTRHGNCVVFDPLPPACLYEELLKPVLQDKESVLPILKVAEFLQNACPEEMLISPRELVMAALMTKNYCQEHPEANTVEVARYYAWFLAYELVPAKDREAFDTVCKPHTPLPRHDRKMPKNFDINKSNETAFDTLRDFLEVRQSRQKGKLPATGGLGGLILEGEPGIGKTTLVIQTLLAQGLNHKNLEDNSGLPGFYHMPVSMPLSKKEALLIKAFDEGSLVVIDEINSAPMMERLLNDLLAGKTPEGNLAAKPGFGIIGTQNPSGMAGRNSPSQAFRRRTFCVKLPEYERGEMILILKNRGLSEKTAASMCDEYLAIRHRFTPPLCFRDLQKAMKQELKRMARQEKQWQELIKALPENPGKVMDWLRQPGNEKPEILNRQDENGNTLLTFAMTALHPEPLILLMLQQGARYETNISQPDPLLKNLHRQLVLLQIHVQKLPPEQQGRDALNTFFQEMKTCFYLMQDKGCDVLKPVCSNLLQDFLKNNHTMLQNIPDIHTADQMDVSFSITAILANIALAIATLGISLIVSAAMHQERGYFGFFASESPVKAHEPVSDFIRSMN